MLEIFLGILVGVCFGIVTGLTPGVHINLISVLILSASVYLLEFVSPLVLAVVIISMAVVHTFLDTIPSTFLGAPEGDTAVSVLPAHRMLLEGKGYEAVMLTVVGSFGALVVAISLVPLLLEIVNPVYSIIKGIIGYILLGISCYLVLGEDKFFWALYVFVFSGILGYGVLNIEGLKNALFPLLSGLFGTSMLLLSLKDKVSIPKQKICGIELERKVGFKAVLGSVFSGWICSFMPGLGPSQAAILGSEVFTGLGNKGFLVLVGGLSTVNMVLSLVTFYILDKARNGAIVAVQEIVTKLELVDFVLIIGTVLIVGGIAVFLTSYISKLFSKMIEKVNYQILVGSIVIVIFILSVVLSGWLGLLILVTATFFGMIPALKEIGRNHMMGCLLIPVMIYFLA